MTPFSLPDLIDFLATQSAADFRGPALDRYLSKFRLDADPFAPFIFFREDTYARNLVIKNDHYEMLVVTWLPGHKTKIHDHSGERCWTAVLSGALTFQNYAMDTQGEKPVPLGGPTTSASGIVYIDDKIGMHSIANASTKPAVSLHIYAAPITQSRVYDEETKKWETVELDYFTTFDGEFGTFGLPTEPGADLD